MPRGSNINDDPVALGHVRELKAIRARSRLTQAELAEKIGGITRGVIASAELSSPRITQRNYNILAQYFSWPPYKGVRDKTLPIEFKASNLGDDVLADGVKELRMPDDLLRDIRAIALIKGISETQILKDLVREYVGKYREELDAIRVGVKDE